MEATRPSQTLVSTCYTTSVILKNAAVWPLNTLPNRQLILDKQAYLNNKINQSKISSNGKCQEEIKDGWFNTEIHNKWQWLSWISICSVNVSRIQLMQQEITKILTRILVWSNIFTCTLCNSVTFSSNLYTASNTTNSINLTQYATGMVVLDHIQAFKYTTLIYPACCGAVLGPWTCWGNRQWNHRWACKGQLCYRVCRTWASLGSL
jgi:hypothetical protein